jgi:hypothetical protein
LSTALVAHVSCAIAGPSAKAAIIPARRIRFMDFLLLVNLPFIAKLQTQVPLSVWVDVRWPRMETVS